MKMLKKLLAVVLTGAMALTLLTACGSNAVTEKDIADAMNEMAKAQGVKATFTPRTAEQEMARKLAALFKSRMETATVADEGDDLDEAMNNILGCKKGGANENNFVWFLTADTDGLGVSEQVNQFRDYVFSTEYAMNGTKLTGQKKTPANIRYMGTALCKIVDEDGKTVTERIAVVTAEPVDEPAD